MKVERAAEAKPQLDHHELEILKKACDCLQADPSLVFQPEFAFFKDLLASWGAAGITGSQKAVDLAAEPKGVLQLASDDEAPPPPQKEMELGLGELEDELEDEMDPGRERDLDILPRDRPPYPPLPPATRSEPSDARKRVLEKVKRQAALALEEGNLAKAVERYTEALQNGAATATMLATRAALLLQQKRPCAAIRDCCAALMLNQDCAKAYLIRGTAQRKLGHYGKAHRDLSYGQKLDFGEEYVAVHDFVAKRLGLSRDAKTGRWLEPVGQWEGKKAAERLFNNSMPQRSDLRPGQAIRVNGLQKAPQLNNKRGVIVRFIESNGRYEVELRLEGGKVETKALQGKNIFVVKATESNAWKEEEKRHAEDRKKFLQEEARWNEEQNRLKKMEEQKKRERLRMEGFPDMEPAEMLEAEMSALPLDDQSLRLLRRLPVDTALGLVKQSNLSTIAPEGLSGYICLKARKLLGEDSDDESVPLQFQSGRGVAASSSFASSGGQELLIDPDEEYDPERLEPEGEPFPPAPPPFDADAEDDSTKAARLPKMKREAEQYWKNGQLDHALARFTDVVLNGGGTAVILAKRAELLLKKKRPCAALTDCTAALAVNPDMGKAYRIRGLALRRLGRWKEALEDLSQAQKLDFDEPTILVRKLVEDKLKLAEAWASRKRARVE